MCRHLFLPPSDTLACPDAMARFASAAIHNGCLPAVLPLCEIRLVGERRTIRPQLRRSLGKCRAAGRCLAELQ